MVIPRPTPPGFALFYPDSPAETASGIAPSATVRCAAGRLEAGDLERAADRLAAFLRTRGAGPGVFIGVGLPRSLDLPIALLAVAKSGAAYVPLDPTYPEARLSHMIRAAGIRLVISRSDITSLFAAAGAPEVIALDAPGSWTPVPAVAEDLPAAGPDDPLYAIFTSGSTGQPKAAAVYRRGFVNLLDWYAGELQLGPADRTLVISSPSFDLTQKNFFAPLRTGGTLVLDDGANYDLSRISALIRDHGITLLNCTPSAFYPLVDAAAAGGYADLASLRFAVLGGEPISIPRLRAWLEHPACRAEVVNTYGPTECTDICAFHRLHRGNLDAFPFVPLGREILHVEVSIRDEDLAPVADGTIGELCIAGAGVGAGYLYDPVQTAARFVADGSLYRTGDLARRLPGGTLEFRGRADHQVKVNGFRIELGEIERALDSHPAVREAVVLAAGDRLVAYVRGEADRAELREHLATTLPVYMLPGDFRFVTGFPLTPNGKVDRLALAAGDVTPPEDEARETSADAAPARAAGDWEARILALWSEILGRPLHDATANFFDLGGTSIHLAVVHVRLRALSGRDLPITDLFARPTAHTLAELLSPRAAHGPGANLQERARLQQAGMARFRRPTPR